MADKSSVKVEHTQEEIQGQPQAKQAKPDDGKVQVNEVRIRVDEPVLDPNSPDAVQVPEGSGASYKDDAPLSDRFVGPTPEEAFSSGDAPKPTSSDSSEKPSKS